MKKVELVAYSPNYMNEIHNIMENDQCSGHLDFEHRTKYEVLRLCSMFNSLEKQKAGIGRLILNENNEVIGSIKLHDLDMNNRNAEILFWYNSAKFDNDYKDLAYEEILKIAFDELNLKVLFFYHRKDDMSQREYQLDEKVGYVDYNIGHLHVNNHKRLEDRERSVIVLNSIYQNRYREEIK